jgi:hypothetical protein
LVDGCQHTNIVFLRTPGHQHVNQRHLFGVVTLLHEGVYREQLQKKTTHYK